MTAVSRHMMRAAAVALLAGALVALLAACGRTSSARDIVRIGWQVPWATQGQVVQALKHTNALELSDLSGRFVGFSYGGPLNEAALADSVDVIFTADQPAAALLAAGGRWWIVARLMYNRTALYVPPRSPVRSLEGLRGKKVGMPYGAAAQRIALQAFRDAGLDPERDIAPVNIDIVQQANLVTSTQSVDWQGIDALAGFDPTPAIFERKGLARILHTGRVTSLVLVSDRFVRAHEDAARRFLAAYLLAWQFYATHRADANKWFIAESRLQVDQAVLDEAAAIEPNAGAVRIEQVNARLSDADVQGLQAAADFAFAHGLARARISMADHIDQHLLARAMESVKALAPQLAAVPERN